mmetsp:Transcript_17517/g.50462  ORF Transcript_17517/g.50462 Transcript_17517/m.50462 type:complete len:775 (-) Transcript_17517:1217-3541(-)
MDPDSYQFEDAPTPPPEPQTPPRHTKFLDLTNGEGGDGMHDVNHPAYEDSDDGGDHDEEELRLSATGTVSIACTPNSKRKSKMMDPGTPGKVVESGQEHTGRWTKEEHEAFLLGLKLYGKEWKKVAAKVKTRTVVQTRTHAQKYFQKLQKAMESGEKDVEALPMGSGSRSSSGKKKRPAASSASKPPPVAPQRQVTSAAHLLSNFSTSADESSPFADAPVPNSSFATETNKPTLYSSPHGFTTYAPPSSASSSHVEESNTQSTPNYATSKPVGFPMKITAPEHDAASRRGKFPEPSPAACGKRKLAEIAAARMLAGVFGSSPHRGSEEDGTTTPPPQPDEEQDCKEMPAPPIVPVGGGPPKSKPGFGLSLQIVNPENLGVSYESEQKRRKEGGSPQTPWEGQLAALVSEEKKKGSDPKQLSLPGPPELSMVGAPPMPTASKEHPVCGPGSAFNRSPLHKAVCELDLAGVQNEVSERPPEFFRRSDSKGFCPIHSACALCLKDQQNSGIATEIVRIMINAGADVSIADSNGNTPLHWAARAGDKSTAEFLLMKAAPIDAKNDRGETPLHWALRAGRRGVPVASVLLDNGARPAIWSKDFKRPIEVAADGFHDEEGSVLELKKLVALRKRLTKEQRRVLKEAMEERKLARASVLQLSAQSRTLVLHHPECLQHIPKSSSDWENPDRVKSILEKLGGGNVYEHEITISTEFDRATLDLLSRIHSTEYLNFVNTLSKDLERQHKELHGDEEESEALGKKPPVVPFTPMVSQAARCPIL